MKTNGDARTQETVIKAGSDAPKLERLLTVEELAELLKVPATWIYSRTRARSVNRLPGLRIGKYWRFRESDVLEWLERQREN